MTAVRIAAIAAVLAALCPNISDAGADPPLEVYLQTLSEDGQYAFSVIYHANHRYDLTEGPASGSTALDGTGGQWWWSADGRFCFRNDSGAFAGQNQCKSNGHYIGRTPVAAGPVGNPSAQRSAAPPVATATPSMGSAPQAALYGRWKTQWPGNPGPWDVVMTITNVTTAAMTGSIWAYRPIDRAGGGPEVPFVGTVAADGSYAFRIANGNGWDGIRICGANLCAIGFNGASGTQKPLVFTRVP